MITHAPRLTIWTLTLAAFLLAACQLPPVAVTQQEHLAAANIYWRPVELEDRPVTSRPDKREPYLILNDSNRAHGYSGCNHFNGSYEQATDALHFKGILSTHRACLPDNDLEQRFFTALDSTASQKKVGESLTLHDQSGKVRARFEALYPR